MSLSAPLSLPSVTVPFGAGSGRRATTRRRRARWLSRSCRYFVAMLAAGARAHG